MVTYTFEEEKEALLATIRDLEKDIYQMKEIDCFRKIRVRQEDFLKYMYLRMDVSYLKSIYHTRRKEILEHITSSFDPFMVKHSISRMEELGYSYETEYFALFCSQIKKTINGYLLELMDPYRKINGLLAKFPEGESEDTLKNHVLRVKINVDKKLLIEGATTEILDVYALPYSLEGDYGIESYSKNNSTCSYPIETRDYDYLKELENAKNQNQAYELCVQMAERMKKDGFFRPLSSEDQETIAKGYLYIRGRFQYYVLIFKNKRVEVITESTRGMDEIDMQYWKEDISDYMRKYDPKMEETLITKY